MFNSSNNPNVFPYFLLWGVIAALFILGGATLLPAVIMSFVLTVILAASGVGK